MKEIKYIQKNVEKGNFEGVLRIIGSIIYLKFSSQQDPRAQQILANLAAKGAEIKTVKEWVKINMFKDQDLVKIEGEEFDVTKLSDIVMEEILYTFFSKKFKEANFEIK